MGACCCLPSRSEPETPLQTKNANGDARTRKSGDRKAKRPDVIRQVLKYEKDDPWGRDKYDGEIIVRGSQLVRNGVGLLSWKDGRCYNGRFQEDMAHGEGSFWVKKEAVDGSPGVYQALVAKGKKFIPVEDKPDKQEWNYGVRCYHGPAEKADSRYQAREGADEESLTILRLPFEPSKPRVLSSGPLGHREAGDGEYAWDYGMPIGSEVLATMGGEVLRYASHFPEGRPEPRFRGKDNFVVIKHDDGTLGTYCHLLQNCIKVQVAQRVVSGDVIGFSGNSGYTSGPHLHFHVAREVDPQMFIQVPARFTGDPIEGKCDKIFICDKVNVCYGMDGPISDEYEGDEGADGPEGYGVLNRADGAVYTGLWKTGKMHGEGHLKYGETDRLDEYTGQFAMGARNGKGTLTWSDGRKYSGEWEENQINGEGILDYTKNDQFKRRRYAGQFFNDMRHGHGRLEWGDGRWYEGPWQHDAVVHRRNLY